MSLFVSVFPTQSSSCRLCYEVIHHFTQTGSPLYTRFSTCQQFISATTIKSLHILVWGQWLLYQYSHSDAMLVPDCWRGLNSEGANNTGHIPRGWVSSQLGLLPSAGLWESSETSGREFCTAVRRFEIRNVTSSSKCCNCLVDWVRRGGCWKDLIQRQQRNLS